MRSDIGVLAVIDDLMSRVQECMEYCREHNLPHATENDSPFLASRMLDHAEMSQLDDAVKSLCKKVRGLSPDENEWIGHFYQLQEYYKSKGYYPRTNTEAYENTLFQLRRTRTFVRVILAEQAHEVELLSARTPANLRRETIMGDVFKNIIESQIISRSTVENTLNTLQSRSDDTVVEFVRALAGEVASSGNPEAGEILDQFNEELAREEPRKSLLNRSWKALVEVLPSVAKIAGATAALAKILG